MTIEFQLADSELISLPTLVFKCKKHQGDMTLRVEAMGNHLSPQILISLPFPTL